MATPVSYDAGQIIATDAAVHTGYLAAAHDAVRAAYYTPIPVTDLAKAANPHRDPKDDQIAALRQMLVDTRSELQKLGYTNLRLIGENDQLARERDALAMRLAELAKAGAEAQKKAEKAPEPTDTRGADLLAAIQTMQGLGIR